MTTTPAGAHPDDGILLRLMDGDADGGEHAPALAHVEACEACRGRMGHWRRRQERLSAVLERTDFPVPASAPPTAHPRPTTLPWAERRWLRAAAVVLLLLGAGLLATPARAWLADRWAALAGRGDLPSVPPSAPVEPQSSVDVQSSAAQVLFVPTGDELAVAVAHPQASGALTLLPAPGASAAAEVVAGTGTADLLVLPSGLHVRNAPGSAAEYRVSVPAAVRRVRVRVAGGGEHVVQRAELGDGGRRIDLRP